MPDLLEIFAHQPAKYDLLVSREDHKGNLAAALRHITAFEGMTVVEFGAGSGRVTRLLAPDVQAISAFDSSRPMLVEAARRLGELGLANWRLDVADHRRVPAPTGAADIAIAGWSICCLAVYSGTDWEKEVDAGLGEMSRVVKPGGRIIIVETLGTGFQSPHPPDSLAAYYARLAARGFQSTWIRTDYCFRSMAEATDLVAFFFGSEPVAALQETRDGYVLPECTGIWWKLNTAEDE
jgi:ubiquinone/menaquinone biosynthesis C-methylase UbiE